MQRLMAVGPLGILPDGSLKDAETGRLTPMFKQPEDTVLFIGAPQDLLVETGTLNRITGKVSVTFTDGAFYSGTCKVSRRLF